METKNTTIKTLNNSKVLKSKKVITGKNKNVLITEKIEKIENPIKEKKERKTTIVKDVKEFTKIIGEKEISLQKSIYNYTSEEKILFFEDSKKLRNQIRNKFRKLISDICVKINNPKVNVTKDDFKIFIDYSTWRYKNFDLSKKLYLDNFCANNTKEEIKADIQKALDLYNKLFANK